MTSQNICQQSIYYQIQDSSTVPINEKKMSLYKSFFPPTLSYQILQTADN